MPLLLVNLVLLALNAVLIGLLAIGVWTGAVSLPWLHKEARPSIEQSDVFDLAAFAREVGLHPSLDLNHLDNDVRDIIAGITCMKEGGPGARLVCKTAQPAVSSCSFTWPLDPVKGAGPRGVAVFERLADVFSTSFSQGGYAWYRQPAAGDDPKAGIAIVRCDDRELRVAFVLSDRSGIETYRSLLRPRGFVWVSRAPTDRPYLPEIFAMAALREISGLIRDDSSGDAFRANDGGVLVDREVMTALRRIPRRDLKVGDNSDFGLGLSRGACALTLQATTLSPSAVVHIAPSEVIEDYHYLTPTVTIVGPDGTPRSVPCPLLTTWLSQVAKPAGALPPVYTGPRMTYERQDGFYGKEGLWRAYAVRTAGVMLYMLGYRVEPADVLVRPSGQWPREDLLSK